MAKLGRVLQKIFGNDGPTNEFGVIGSDAAGSPTNTKNLATMQSLSQYDDGLFAIAPNADEPPSAEDINSMYNLTTSQIAYLMQAGIPEWETNTDYYIGSYVQVSGNLYVSLTGVDPTPNQGNDPTTSLSNWSLVLPNKMQDVIVYSQETFNNVIERVAANQYKIRDDIQSIYCANLSGGYLMTGGTSPLSGGDTWGYIETNNCAQIIFESGAYIYFDDTQGYIEVNTDDCLLQNVSVVGLGTAAPATLDQSFLLNAERVIFLNCHTYNRISPEHYSGFRGSVTASHNKSSNYYSCSVHDIEVVTGSTSASGGFRDCENLIDCSVYNVAVNAYLGYMFKGCKNLLNCTAYNIVSPSLSLAAFYECIKDVNCTAYNIINSVGGVSGFLGCSDISSCAADQIDHDGSVAGQNAYGFISCTDISSCKASNVDTNGAGGENSGFKSCTAIAACTGIYCRIGFDASNGISSSFADSNSAHGFADCERVSGSKATNNTFYGFTSCLQLNTNRSTGNGTAQYNLSYADFGGAQGAADTANGGYNG